ncbi:hypothetical protein JCM10212_007027 [Sporobolomyces blumeae]
MSAQSRRVRGVSVFRPVIYGNSTTLLSEQERQGTDHTHRWTVGVRSAASPAQPNLHPNHQIGGADDLSYFIKKVTFKLYETYKNPLRTIEQPPFEVTETGWGEFDIVIKVFFVPEASEKPLTFNHHLKLHPWPVDPILYAQPSLHQAPPATTATSPAAVANGAVTDGSTSAQGDRPSTTTNAGGASGPDATTTTTTSAQLVSPVPVISPVHSWQYEEIVFSEPTEQFYTTLLTHPPTPLPPTNRHPKVLTHALSGGGNIGEFSLEMERSELERLEGAKVKTLKQVDEMRKLLVEYERELTGLKAEVEGIQTSQTQAQPPPNPSS